MSPCRRLLTLLVTSQVMRRELDVTNGKLLRRRVKGGLQSRQSVVLEHVEQRLWRASGREGMREQVGRAYRGLSPQEMQRKSLDTNSLSGVVKTQEQQPSALVSKACESMGWVGKREKSASPR